MKKKHEPVLVVVEDHVDSSQQAVEVPQGVHPDPPEAVEAPRWVHLDWAAPFEAVGDLVVFPVLALIFDIHHKLKFF